MKLIVNGDDFGLSESVNEGIIYAYNNGILRSTTLMINMPFVNHAIMLAKKNSGLGIGIHLVATAGKPLLKKNKTLSDENGYFIKNTLILQDKVKLDVNELYEEWDFQIKKFIELMGKKPTHIDSHHFVHMNESYREIALKLAQKYSLPMRWDFYNEEDMFTKTISGFFGNDIGCENFKRASEEAMNYEVADIMTHPGFIDDNLRSSSSYVEKRQVELEVLVSDEIKNWIKKNNIELINYEYFKKENL
ncbi:MAG: chitin disaccharide deacetylase [Sarcina sp.]